MGRRGSASRPISPRTTPTKQQQEQSGGVTVDNSSAETHTTIFAIGESPRDSMTVWAGTDDGNLQLTRNGGKTWTNVAGNIAGLPKNAWVSSVEPGHFSAGTIYATFDLHTFGDVRPYAYRSTDFGKTWTPLVAPGSPVRGYAHVIKEDLVNPQLLFLGTEFGLWITVDGGQHWSRYKGGNMPAVAVRDLAIHPRDDDLVIATHGRGIWIVDNITPLRKLTPQTRGARRRIRRDEAGRAAALGVRRLVEWRRGVRRSESARRRVDHLLPAAPPHLRRHEARGVRLGPASSFNRCRPENVAA